MSYSSRPEPFAGTLRAVGRSHGGALPFLPARLGFPLFTAAITPPIVVTVAEAPALERKKAADLADVIIAGERDVDLAAALGALAERGYARVLAEGGPTLNGQLAAAGLLDELCLTVSPLLAGGGAKRILTGPALPSGSGWQIRSLCEQDGFLFLRYRPQ
jgi:riboflavin biosynthesis pyrimidine reductase